MQTVLIVEEHPMIRKQIRNTIHWNLKDITVLEAGNEKEAVELLEKNDIDLFYLDIQLVNINGLKVAEKIRSIPKYEFTYIIFIANFMHLLPQSLQEYHCYDFIQKPFQSQQIIKLTRKLLYGPQLEKKEKEVLYLTIHEKNHITNIPVQEIYFIESIRRKVYIHTTKGIKVITTYSLCNIEDSLLQVENITFLRTHRSYIVNQNRMKSIRLNQNIPGEICFYGYEKKAKLGKKFEKDLKSQILEREI